MFALCFFITVVELPMQLQEANFPKMGTCFEMLVIISLIKNGHPLFYQKFLLDWCY